MKQAVKDKLFWHVFDFASWLGKEFGFFVHTINWNENYKVMSERRNLILQKYNELFREHERLKVKIKYEL